MQVYIFGNEDVERDNKAIEILKELENDFPMLEFITIKPNQDLPLDNREDAILIDTAEGVDQIEVLGSKDLDKIGLSSSVSAHDFDLGFQLKYLNKLEKLGEVTIIVLPTNKEPDYLRIQSILRKLVAQDMQGS